MIYMTFVKPSGDQRCHNMKFFVSRYHDIAKIHHDIPRYDKYTQICYDIKYFLLNIIYICQNTMHMLFIICHSFLIQAHGAIKYLVKHVENVCFYNNICFHFAKDIAFLYHNIPFMYIMIIMKFYITIYVSSITIIVASLVVTPCVHC